METNFIDPFLMGELFTPMIDVSSFGTILPRPSPVKIEKKVGRNEQCPCNSGKKFKHCCIGKKGGIS